jgi:hypothetical protein
MTRPWLSGLLAGVGGAALIAAELLDRSGAPAPAPAAMVQIDDGDDLTVAEIIARPRDVAAGQSTLLSVRVRRGRDRGGEFAIDWAAGGGRIDTGEAGVVRWWAPSRPGVYRIRVTARDGDGSATDALTMFVRVPPAGVARTAPDGDRRASIEQELDRLRAAVAASAHGTIARRDALAAFGALLLEAEAYEEALAVYGELRGFVLRGDGDHADYTEAWGTAAYYLGHDDWAIDAFEEAGLHAGALPLYYLGDLYERRDDVDGAIDAYMRSHQLGHWYGEPVYRAALLMLERGDGADAVARLLVDASPRLGRDHMLDRFRTDPELAVLGRMLDDTGRTADLLDQRPFIGTEQGTFEIPDGMSADERVSQLQSEAGSSAP